MALLLRQACEPLLAKYNLHEYHADLEPKDKKLVLKTNNCGKIFTYIPGVEFGRLQPTKAEIDYAVQLLGIWLNRNKDLIEDFLEAFFEREQTKEPAGEITMNGVKYAVGSERKYDHDEKRWRREVQTLKIHLNDETIDGKKTGRYFVYNREGLWDMGWNGVWDGKLNTLAVCPPKALKAGMEFYQEHLDHEELDEKVSRLRAKLNQCEM